MGLIAMIFRRQVAKATVEMNHKIFGVKLNPRIYEITFLIAGLVLVAAGILNFSGVIG